MKGENNPRYTKKETLKCNNCGKQFERIPSSSYNKNKYGEIHNFCCRECYWNFRKIYYVGDKLYNTGQKMSKEFCDKVRDATLRQYSEGILDRQTKPQIIVNEILSNNNIKYINEKIYKYYSVDNYLIESNLIIEVMGDYFHANPLLYKTYDKLNKMQKKDIIRDMRKHTYIKKYYNINILYLWENDIKNSPKLCECLIWEYINNNGILKDYNSFNYSLEINKVTLNKNIQNPYFIITP